MQIKRGGAGEALEQRRAPASLDFVGLVDVAPVEDVHLDGHASVNRLDTLISRHGITRVDIVKVIDGRVASRTRQPHPFTSRSADPALRIAPR